MSSDDTLKTTSLLAIVLMTFHLSDDVVRGFEPGGLKNLIGIAILVVWLYAAVMLIGRRSGYVILGLGSLLAAAIPAAHMAGKGVGGEIAASNGGHFFIWTLLALGVVGTFSLILSVRGLWSRLRGRTAA